MPKLTNAVPRYRKHRASGQAVVDIAGKTHYLGPHGTEASKVEYDRLIAEWLAAGRSPSFGATPHERSISEILVAYLIYAKVYYGDDPRSEYATMVRAVKPVKRLYSRKSAADFGPTEFEAIRLTMIDSGNSRTYINATMQRVVRVFRWGAAKGMIPESVPRTLALVPGLKKGRTEAVEASPIEPVSESAVQETLPYLSKIVASMVQFQRATGCRPSEVCILRPCDIDKSSDVWQYRPESHKNEHRGQERVVFVGPKAQTILAPFLLRAADAYCFSPQEADRRRRADLTANRKTPVSCGNKVGSNRRRTPKLQPKEHYTTNTFSQAIRRACVKASIDVWGANRLRHSSATEVRRQFGIEAARVALGHAQMATTEIYAERDHELAARVARQIG